MNEPNASKSIQLIMYAELTHEAQPKHRATFEYAKQLVDEIIQQREGA